MALTYHDYHTHVSLYAALAGCPDLASCADIAVALGLLREQPEDRLTVVKGWHSGRLPFSATDLAGLPPLVILNLSLHGLRLTPAAARMLRDREPEIVERHGNPHWCERNLPVLLAFYGRSAGVDAARLDAFMNGLDGLGIGSAEDLLLTDASALAVIRASRWADRLAFWASPEVFRCLDADARSVIRGLKFFLDGALGTRTAALSEPYLDGSPGCLVHSREELARQLAECHPIGKALALHAIGDRAIQQALDVLADLDRNGLRFPGIRLEHVQFITEAQARKARGLGLVLSMQPNFNTDSLDYADRLAPSWREANNPFRMLIDRVGFRPGADLVFGSDGMPHGVEAAWAVGRAPAFSGQRLERAELEAGYRKERGSAFA